jgi:microcystin-dependent protein
MADPFVAEIRIYPFNFPPTGWAFCNGQLLPLSQNTALFALLGTTYGGNGQSNFALPDLQGSAPMQPGQGPGLSLHDLGEMGGTEYVTLLESEIPAHTHSVMAQNFPGSTNVATNNNLARGASGLLPFAPAGGGQTTMAPQTFSVAGGSLPHNNMQPYLALNFCIALQGVFPPRS